MDTQPKRKNEKKNPLVLDEATIAANRFLLSFDAYQKLTEVEKKRWQALAKQIESDVSKKDEIIQMLKRRQLGR